jgi:spore maturation protein CgeB
MRLFVSTGDFANHLTPNFFNLLNELEKRAELYVCHQSGDINEMVAACPRKPDFVFINEYGETNSPKITGLASLNIPFGVLLHDLHYNIPIRRELLKREKVKYVFTLYRDKFYEWYPQFWQQMRWLPHQVNTDVFLDYGLKKEIDCLMMGAIHPYIYPLRHKILNAMKDRPGFVYHEHPGYKNFSDQDRKELYIGENYAREINRARMFITCNSRYGYSLAKYFEVLACKTLLLAPVTQEIRDLGLIPGVHFAAINDVNYDRVISYYLENENERELIASQGYELVRSQHSTRKRAGDLLGYIEDILNETEAPAQAGEELSKIQR